MLEQMVCQKSAAIYGRYRRCCHRLPGLGSRAKRLHKTVNGCFRSAMSDQDWFLLLVGPAKRRIGVDTDEEGPTGRAPRPTMSTC